MGIEAIGSIGSSVGNVASAVGRGVSSIGRISDFGPKLEGPLTAIVNEGPVGFADMKNTMPLQIGQKNPITEINFQPQPALNASDVVAEAESILAQAHTC